MTYVIYTRYTLYTYYITYILNTYILFILNYTYILIICSADSLKVIQRRILKTMVILENAYNAQRNFILPFFRSIKPR